MPIIPLAQRPEYLTVLAALHHPQWQAAHPDWTRSDWKKEFARHLGDFPCTLIALNTQDELLGSASLVEDDMNGAMDYSPWLANVLVLPAARGSGVGGKLIAAIEAKAAAMNFPALHLFTEDQQPLYQRRGWQAFHEMAFEGKAVSLMRKTLQPATL
jgi:GNAT superfamily N-acetyltransferase